MSFRTFFLGLDSDQRSAYAARADSTVGYLTQVAYGNKQVDLGFADVLVRVSDGALALGDLPLTDRARQQHAIRSAPTTEPAAAGG
jgi:hypothetical protein